MTRGVLEHLVPVVALPIGANDDERTPAAEPEAFVVTRRGPGAVVKTYPAPSRAVAEKIKRHAERKYPTAVVEVALATGGSR